MKNQVPARSAGRQPRGLVKVNGARLTGWVRADVDQNTFYEPDKFTLYLAIGGLPNAMNADWWSTAGQIEVEIFAGFPADPDSYGDGDLDSLFFGVVDEARVDWGTRTIEVTGRDLTSKLIDHKTTEKYVNKTASEVASTLAGKYGLTPVVTATKTKIGRYYQIDHVDLKDDRTEWDLLTWLAREEGFAVYVKGKELHFEPAPKAGQDPYVIRYAEATEDGPAQANAQEIKTSRSLTVARDIQVTVTSWNHKQKQPFKVTSTRTKNQRGPGPKGEAQKYSYSIGGLTKDQAQKRADQIRDELSKHEMKLSFDGPADNLLGVSDVIKLEGTGTAYDQVYFPDSIARSLTFDGGYEWSVSAKNHSPESEPAL